MDIISALEWRYATKRMTGRPIPREKVDAIIKAAHLAPSGIGLQPYEIMVISNQSLKEKLRPIAMNQPQITESSYLLVFAAWDNYSHERIDKVFDHLNLVRKTDQTIADRQRNFAKQFFGKMTMEENFHHAAKQANIALGLAIATAALCQIDAAPMEGFDPIALDEALGLSEKGLRSSMLLALGLRDEKMDWNLKLKKVRKPLDEFITVLK
jgi:nitroreductase/dihydropteridine reductase